MEGSPGFRSVFLKGLLGSGGSGLPFPESHKMSCLLCLPSIYDMLSHLRLEAIGLYVVMINSLISILFKLVHRCWLHCDVLIRVFFMMADLDLHL